MNIKDFCPISPDYSIDWDAIHDEFEWFRRLESCEQDPIWHAEGNVLVHTKMVCQALVDLPEWKQLSRSDQLVTFLAALTHDIAKPITTKTNNGRIVAPKHAIKGAFMVREMLIKDGLEVNRLDDLLLREQVVQLVRFHGVPLRFDSRSDPDLEAIRLSFALNNRLVALVAQADVLGRICEDQDKLLEQVDLFRELCREHDCYEKPKAFANDSVKTMYFAGKGISPDAHFDEPSKGQVTLLSGLPGSGKDFWIAKNANEHNIVSLDQLRIEMGVDPRGNQGLVVNRGKELAKSYMRESKDFVWNATNITKLLRRQLITLFTEYQYKVRLIYLETNWQTLLQRHRERPDGKRVPQAVLDKMVQRLEVPTADEAHSVHWEVN